MIAFDTTPAAADALLYAAVAVTVVSGADYFFGVRRHMERGAARGRLEPLRSLRRALEPLAHRHVMR